MSTQHIHTSFYIQELNSYGVSLGPGGQSLKDMDYYDLRSLLVIEQMKRDTDINMSAPASRWF